MKLLQKSKFIQLKITKLLFVKKRAYFSQHAFPGTSDSSVCVSNPNIWIRLQFKNKTKIEYSLSPRNTFLVRW